MGDRTADGSGYIHYEVSNFARPGREARHNWGYWTGAEYLGVGASAHSFALGRRWWNERDPERYVEAVEKGGLPGEGGEEIDPCTAERERIWMGLRTRAGIALRREARSLLRRASRFRALEEAGFLKLRGNRLRATRRGFLVADALGIEVSEILERASEKERARRFVPSSPSSKEAP